MEKTINTAEIAKITGVSQTTVMNVLHGRTNKMKKETFDKIEKIIKSSGYVRRVAPGLMTDKNTNLFGLFIGGVNQQEMERCAQVLIRIEQELYKMNCFLLIHSAEEISEIIHYSKAWNLDGIITIKGGKESIDYVKGRRKAIVKDIDCYMLNLWSFQEIELWIKELLKNNIEH